MRPNSADELRWYDERVEAYVDGELSDEERMLFSQRLAVDPSLRAQVAFAEQVSLSLTAIPQPKAPDSLVAKLDAISSRPRPAVANIIPLRRTLGIAASVLAVALAGLLGVSNLSTRATQPTDLQASANADYSQPEVDRAMREVKYALAVVSEAGRHAGVAVKESVFQDQKVIDRQ